MSNHFTRRQVLRSAALAGIGLALERSPLALAQTDLRVRSKGNPLFPGLGVCDPQVRVYNDQVYLYATHDASPSNRKFTMNNWWVWHTTDLVNWQEVSVLQPEETYLHKPWKSCWATDAASRNGKYYFYFSAGRLDVGVVVGDTPSGPWHDPLGHPLIAQGSVDTQARDPAILQEPDGTSYIVFGTFNYYIARLNEDMISLAEAPRLIHIENPKGPYGKGKTDDKPFLHRRGNKYYLSWGCYYSISDSPYGPYDCKGSIIRADHMAPMFRDVSQWGGLDMVPALKGEKAWLTHDRHGSFFTLHGQWYFICNDESQPGATPFFRDSILSYVRYKENGEIDPIRITPVGVGQYDANVGMEATDFFAASAAEVREAPGGSFDVRVLKDRATLTYPNVHNLRTNSTLVVEGSLITDRRVVIEVRRGSHAGLLLGKSELKKDGNKGNGWSIPLQHVESTNDLCLTFHGSSGELASIRRLSFL